MQWFDGFSIGVKFSNLIMLVKFVRIIVFVRKRWLLSGFCRQ